VLPSHANAQDADRTHVAIAALLVGLAAFLLYGATLLPGVDFGDTGSLKTTAGSRAITPREGYPLYFAIGGAFDAAARATGSDPAHALNLASAAEAAGALALFVMVGVELTGSILAATAAAMLFAVSYTFWSQAIIAEVYALHALLLLLSLWLLLRWSRGPTIGRLAAFFAAFAIGFGNHLSMILLAPGYALFLLLSAPHGWRSMLRPRILGLALSIAALGAAQYLWNLHTLWTLPQPPASLVEALRTFWFDVTKSDWRDTMVLTVPDSMVSDHRAMYWFDLRQQFGAIVPLLAVAGVAALSLENWKRALMLVLLYGVNVAFAFNYNVGDAHVFYLPSHLFVALSAAPAIAAARRIGRLGGPAFALMLALYAGSRAVHDFPALDRSGDHRPLDALRAITAGLDDRTGIFLVDMNWQNANGLSYYTRAIRPEIAVARLRDVLLYAPALIADNLAIGRRVVLTERARQDLVDSYGPLIDVRPDGNPPPTLTAVVDALPRRARYALCLLKPSRDFAADPDDLTRAIERLSGGRRSSLPAGDYVALAGLAGEPPIAVAASNRPFATQVQLDGIPIEIRMESWLAADTIRRMGFGHVIVNRRHTLIVERGVSFVAFDRDGTPFQTGYWANLFEREQRYVVAPQP